MSWLVEISCPNPVGWMIVSCRQDGRGAKRVFEKMQRSIDPGVSLRLVHNLSTVATFHKHKKQKAPK